MDQIPIVISVAALIIAFFAVVLARRPSEPAKEKKTRRKRQPQHSRLRAEWKRRHHRGREEARQSLEFRNARSRCDRGRRAHSVTGARAKTYACAGNVAQPNWKLDLGSMSLCNS